MKLKNFLIGFLGVVALSACSSDSPGDNGADPIEIGQGENFISVSIEMSASSGSRATDGPFDDGTENESLVSNIVFFFFDEGGNCIEVQKKDNPVFTKPVEPSLNPNISKYGVVEVRLKAGLKYDRVAVALNSPANDATSLKAAINTLDDLLARTYDYVTASKVNTNGGTGQVMSNSVYFDMKEASTTPTEDKRVDVIKITSDNIYNADERDEIEQKIAKGEKKYVEIFVERVLSRIDVSKPSFDMKEVYYIYKENGDEKKEITVMDYVNNSSRKVAIRPVVKGIVLNVTTPRTALIKPLYSDELGYKLNPTTDKDFMNFEWNDPINKRSYWASTAFLAAKDMKYVSWNKAVGKGTDGFTEYIHPNTQAYEPTFENEGSSQNTKVMMVAELHEFEGDTDKGAVDLVMFGQDYMLYADFRAHVAALVNRDIINIDWNDVKFKAGDTDFNLTQEQAAAVAKSVSDAFNKEGASTYADSDFELVVANSAYQDTGFGDQDWIAKVQMTASGTGKTITLNGLPTVDALTAENSLLKQVSAKIDEMVTASVRRINDKDNNLLYWKAGCTYFYTNIRHQGFTGLTGEDNNFLFGVVRNHIYKVNLTGIYGLGTPVIDPERPINPDRPGGGNPSYIKAKINILPWRVVTYNATIH